MEPTGRMRGPSKRLIPLRSDRDRGSLGEQLHRSQVPPADRGSLARQAGRQRPLRIPLRVLAGVLVLGAIVALGALRVGAYPFGTAAADDAQSCTMPAALAADAPSLNEHARFSATRTWIPLGLICTIDEPGDSRAPQTTVHQSWTATWTAAGATGVAGVALVWILVRIGQALRRRGPGTRVEPSGAA